MSSIRVLIVDDHPVVREKVATMLSRQEGMNAGRIHL